jgi:hypothetical protein
MNIYLISQDKNTDYDSFDSAVVTATNKDSARLIHPLNENNPWDGVDGIYSSWTDSKNVKVKLIGVSNSNVSGVICASFNAG